MFFVEAVFFWLVRDLRQEEGPLADNVLEQGWTEGAASRREVGAVGSFAQRDFAGKYCAASKQLPARGPRCARWCRLRLRDWSC
jgi:hypothetical protein